MVRLSSDQYYTHGAKAFHSIVEDYHCVWLCLVWRRCLQVLSWMRCFTAKLEYNRIGLFLVVSMSSWTNAKDAVRIHD